MAKKKLIYKNKQALEPIKKVVDEASEALNNKERTIKDSPISETLGSALGMGVGGAVSFAALYFGGSVVGLSAAGITSGLAAAGGIVGGGMAAGVAVLAAPVAVFGVIGYKIISNRNKKKLIQAKELLLQEVIKKHDAIIRALKKESDTRKERVDYLNSLNILLQAAIKDLKKDLATNA